VRALQGLANMEELDWERKGSQDGAKQIATCFDFAFVCSYLHSSISVTLRTALFFFFFCTFKKNRYRIHYNSPNLSCGSTFVLVEPCQPWKASVALEQVAPRTLGKGKTEQNAGGTESSHYLYTHALFLGSYPKTR